MIGSYGRMVKGKGYLCDLPALNFRHFVSWRTVLCSMYSRREHIQVSSSDPKKMTSLWVGYKR